MISRQQGASWGIPLLFVVFMCLLSLVRAEIPACNTHPMHTDTSYQLEAPWGQADGSDPRTWDVYFTHDIYADSPTEETGSGSFFACPELKGKYSCCEYSTYMHMKKQVVQMYEMFFNETMIDLNNYTAKFQTMVRDFVDALKTAITIVDDFTDLRWGDNDVDLKDVNVVIAYIMMFVDRIWSVAYESVGTSATCIRNFMIYYAGLWCLSCDQEDYPTYIKGGQIQLAAGELEKIGTPCGDPIVKPLGNLADDMIEMVMKFIDPNSWWYSMLETARGLLKSTVLEIAANIVGKMTSANLADTLNGADLGYLVKKDGSDFSLEAFGPLSIGVWIYGVMKWIDDSIFGWVPDSVKRDSGLIVASENLQREALRLDSTLDVPDDHPLNFVTPNPHFEDHPFAGWLTIMYNTVVQHASKFGDSDDIETLNLLEEGRNYVVDILGVPEVAFLSDIESENIRVQSVVKSDGAPDVGIIELEEGAGGYSVFAVGLKTGYFPNVSEETLTGGFGGGFNVDGGNENDANAQQSTFSGTEYLAAAGVVFMIMGSCAQGKRAAARAAAKNLKKKKSKNAKSGMDRLLAERKKTKLSKEAKQNLIAPSTSQFDAFMDRVGGTVGKHNKVELISEDLRRPTSRATTGPPRPSEGSKERLEGMTRAIEQQRVVKKVRAF